MPEPITVSQPVAAQLANAGYDQQGTHFIWLDNPAEWGWYLRHRPLDARGLLPWLAAPTSDELLAWLGDRHVVMLRSHPGGGLSPYLAGYYDDMGSLRIETGAETPAEALGHLVCKLLEAK